MPADPEGIVSPFVDGGTDLAEASSDEAPSPELRAVMDAPIGRVMNAIDALIWLALIYVMVAKPFS
jgi:hypothetical protein